MMLSSYSESLPRVQLFEAAILLSSVEAEDDNRVLA